MKYLGKITDAKDLVTKEYVDNANENKVSTSDYNPDSKTSAMTQAVGKDANGKLWTTPAPSEDVFVAEYGVTTYAEITAARNAGKACFMRESELGLVAMYAEIGMGTPPGGSGMGSAYIFNATADGKVYSYYCWSSGVWEERYSPIGTYSKPSGGIPKTDLAQAVQTSLGKADTALQSVPNTYRTAAAQDLIDAGKADADLGVTGATVGQYVKIKTVDGVGNPTSFEPGTPSGGGADVPLTVVSGKICITYEVST